MDSPYCELRTRLAFIEILHVTMHMKRPDYDAHTASETLSMKCAKVMAGLDAARKRERKLLTPVEQRDNDTDDDYSDDDREEGFTIPGVAEANLEPEQFVQIFAFVKAKGFKPAGRGATGRFVKCSSCRGR